MTAGGVLTRVLHERRRDHTVNTVEQALHQGFANPHMPRVDHFPDLFQRGGVGKSVAIGRTTGIQGLHGLVVVRVGAGSDYT